MKANTLVVLLQERGPVEAADIVECGQGIALLAEAGYEARGILIRTPRQREQAAELILDSPPQLVFLCVGRDEVPSALALLNAIRNLPPTTHIAIGGCYGTLCSHDFTTHLTPGAILLGQWVESLVELARQISGRGSGADINGVWWRGGRGWQLTGRRKYAPNLHAWPDPLPDDFRLKDILRLNGGAYPITASRGFPFQTLFNAEPLLRHLTVSEGWYFPRPPERVVADARDAMQRFKVRSFNFTDDIFPWDRDWTIAFAALWAEEVKRPFTIRTASDHLFLPRLKLLKGAGLVSVELGLESGDESLRRRLSDLNESNQLVMEGLDNCRAAGIDTRLRFLVGVPHETADTLGKTVAFARDARATHVSAERYEHWPESTHWAEVERSLTGGIIPRLQYRQRTELSRTIVQAIQEVTAINSLTLGGLTPRDADAALDAIPEFGVAKVRSPYELAARIMHFHGSVSGHPVIALRVPAAITWSFTVPRHPVLEFGILLEPSLPGERARHPVSLAVRLSQRERSFRLFEKVLIESLDPDSRQWHWFKIPLAGVKRGWAELTLETIVTGHDANYVPPDHDIWAGWARVKVTSLDPSLLDDETTENVITRGEGFFEALDLHGE